MSLYTLDNGILRITFNKTGGEPISVGIRNGENITEILWNGNEKYWSSHAPLLFPTIGRLRGGSWICNGCEYQLGIHGFARFLDPKEVRQSSDSIEFHFCQTPETLSTYPYPFNLCRSFHLEGANIISRVTVKNTGKEILPFSVGLHPGFMLPGERSRLKVEYDCPPEQLLLSENFFMSGRSKPYVLRDEKYIELDNSLFDHDAIILTNVTAVTLESMDKTEKQPYSVRVSCPDAQTFGFWQPMHSDAPFICIEPWRGIPSFDAPDSTPPDDALTRRGMTLLKPGEVYTYNCKIEIKQI